MWIRCLKPCDEPPLGPLQEVIDCRQLRLPELLGGLGVRPARGRGQGSGLPSISQAHSNGRQGWEAGMLPGWLWGCLPEVLECSLHTSGAVEQPRVISRCSFQAQARQHETALASPGSGTPPSWCLVAQAARASTAVHQGQSRKQQGLVGYDVEARGDPSSAEAQVPPAVSDGSVWLCRTGHPGVPEGQAQGLGWLH